MDDSSILISYLLGLESILGTLEGHYTV